SERSGARQRRHHSAGESDRLPDRREALRESPFGGSSGSAEGLGQAAPELQASRQEGALQSEPLCPRATNQAGQERDQEVAQLSRPSTAGCRTQVAYSVSKFQRTAQERRAHSHAREE